MRLEPGAFDYDPDVSYTVMLDGEPVATGPTLVGLVPHLHARHIAPCARITAWRVHDLTDLEPVVVSYRYRPHRSIYSIVIGCTEDFIEIFRTHMEHRALEAT